MYLIPIAWLYVVGMMAIAEATGSGTLLGALFTFLLYGLMPLGLVMYLLGTPQRRAARRRTEAAASAEAADTAAAAPADDSAPDARGHAAGDAVAPERKEP